MLCWTMSQKVVDCSFHVLLYLALGCTSNVLVKGAYYHHSHSSFSVDVCEKWQVRVENKLYMYSHRNPLHVNWLTELNWTESVFPKGPRQTKMAQFVHIFPCLFSTRSWIHNIVTCSVHLWDFSNSLSVHACLLSFKYSFSLTSCFQGHLSSNTHIFQPVLIWNTMLNSPVGIVYK